MPTDYFFVMPSAVRGAASVIDLGGALREGDYVFVPTSADADELAQVADQRALERDFRAARVQLEAELPTRSE